MMFKGLAFSFLVSMFSGWGQSSPPDSLPSVPIATQWLYDAVAPGSKGTVDSVVRILCKKTNAVGSGFILDSGYVITNHHVVEGCAALDLDILTSNAATIPMADLWLDERRDLAVVRPKSPLKGTFKIEPSDRIAVGTQLSTWGYPFAHPGPAPLLTVGYLSGFYNSGGQAPNSPVKRLVINGAFNPGNSGGPLISPDGAIIGVVVAKRIIPLTPGIQSAMNALANNKSGLMYSGQQDGKAITISESQVIASVLDYYRQASQVFIGEAIAATELVKFLDEKKIPWGQSAKAQESTKKQAVGSAKSAKVQR